MKKYLFILCTAMIFPTLLLSACGNGKVAKSNLKRDLNPKTAPSNQEQLVMGNTAFAFDLYLAMDPSGGNMVFSPYSISTALAMAYGGARNETADQMAEILHYTLPGDQFHAAFNALDLDLAQRPDQVADVNQKERFKLSIANSLWGQEGWSFVQDYLDLLVVNYSAGMRLVDFEKEPENAREQINAWISKQTHKRIQNIIPPGTLDPLTRLVLANAIYFKATWEKEFDANDTSEKPFNLLNGETVNVPMMGMEISTGYASGNGWQAVALPYKGGLTEMLVIVPDAGEFESFRSTLTAEGYDEILAAMQTQMLILSIPKFSFETNFSLEDTLVHMGMRNAFDEDLADFSGMDNQHLLYIGDAIHKAFIAVDEKGTEAAAATIVMMRPASLPQGIDLTIDRPFFYVIRDVPTGTILFMGQVVDPR